MRALVRKTTPPPHDGMAQKFRFMSVDTRGRFGLSPVQAFLKRSFDLVASFLGLLCVLWLIAVAWLLATIDTGMNGFFTQRRVGRHGRQFNVIKIRTMRPCGKVNSTVTTALDHRITRLGRFWRQTKIDELPQLFNVLLGQMSLVGPRPHLPEEVAKYENYHRKALTVKPGITGLAQVSGRSDLSFEEEVKLDVYYIENWTMMLDISILFRTPLAVFKHREAE